MAAKKEVAPLNQDELSRIKTFEGQELAQRAVPAGTAVVSVEQERAMAEVQGAIILAKKFPRDQRSAIDKIKIACQRPGLADAALYSYARGGTDITGPTIRLAEEIARGWGNLQYGIRELDQREGESTVEAFCWDMETNVRVTRTFQVKHIRYTRARTYDLDDPRDIYETVANQGARRLRACILENIPGDVVDGAVEQCEATLKAEADLSPAAIKKMLDMFGKFSVTKEQIEKRIQRNLDAITAAQVVALRKIHNSLRDGMSKAGDWFPTGETKVATGESGAASDAGSSGGQAPPTGTPEKVLSKNACPNLVGTDREGQQEDETVCKECVNRLGCPGW